MKKSTWLVMNSQLIAEMYIYIYIIYIIIILEVLRYSPFPDDLTIG